MNIVILGAGALGAYFGARWEEVGQQVTYLVRSGRAKHLKEKGITLNSVQGDYQVKNPSVIENPHEVDSVDLVVLAVKGQHLHGVLDNLKVLVEKGAKVLPLLNGIEHISILQEALGEEAVLGGLSFIISTLDEKGDVVHTSAFHDIVFGALHPSQQPLCEELNILTEKANMNLVLSEDISLEMWKKYMFISAFSGITTATNLPIGPIRNNPDTFQVTKNILIDMKNLANAYEIAITDAHVEEAFEKLKTLNEEATSSMHQDRRKGLPLEVDHLHGGALRLANKANIKLPTVETIHGIIVF